MANSETRVTTAVKQPAAEAPQLVGAPAEYLDGGIRSVTYPLKVPFRIDGQEYRELTAYKLTGKEIFAMNKRARDPSNTFDPEVLVFAVMCKVSPRVIEALDGSDIQGLSQKTGDFTRQLAENPQGPTGENGENT